MDFYNCINRCLFYTRQTSFPKLDEGESTQFSYKNRKIAMQATDWMVFILCHFNPIIFSLFNSTDFDIFPQRADFSNYFYYHYY